MRVIDANWVKGKLLNVIRTVTDDMRDAVVYGDDEIYVACENQKSAYTTSIKLLDLAPTIEAVPVDEFVEKLCEKLMENSDTIESEGVSVDVLTLDCAVETVMEIAEQMKGGNVVIT